MNRENWFVRLLLRLTCWRFGHDWRTYEYVYPDKRVCLICNKREPRDPPTFAANHTDEAQT